MPASMIARKSDDLYRRMIMYVLARTRMSDIRDTDPAVQILAAVAEEIARSDKNAADRSNESSLDGAQREILDDLLAAILPYGLPRSPGTYAAGGGLTFTRPFGSSGALTVVKGALVSRNRDGTLFKTLADATFTGVNTTSSAAPIVCQSRGLIGNSQIGEINSLATTIAGVTGCTNTLEIVNGQDAESDQAARDRARRYVKYISPCTNNGIINQVLNYQSDSFGTVKFAAWGAYDPSKPGYATLYIDDGNGTSGPTETKSAESASSLAFSGNRYVIYTKYRPLKTTPTITYAGGLGVPSKTLWVYPLGQALITPGTTAVPSSGLFSVGSYDVYSGLVGEVQSLLDGTLSNVEQQGFTGAGNVIQVLPAVFTGYLTISANITWADGTNVIAQSAVLKAALTNFINNTKGIGQGVSQLDVATTFKANPSVLNVTDILIDGVDGDKAAGANEVLRTQPPRITLF